MKKLIIVLLFAPLAIFAQPQKGGDKIGGLTTGGGADTIYTDDGTMIVNGDTLPDFAATSWKLSGNTITSGNFVGTLNGLDLEFRRGGIFSGKIGNNLTSFGVLAGNSSTGADNSAFGYSALFSNTTGIENVAMGRSALYYTNGSKNTAIGVSALANSIGSRNVGLGFNAGINNTTAFGNTLLGTNAGANFTTGDFNTVVGDSSYVDTTNYSNVTIVGYNAQPDASNQIRLGNTNSTQLWTGNYRFNIDETVGAGQDNYVMTYDNGTGEIGLEAASGGGNGIYGGSDSLSQLFTYAEMDSLGTQSFAIGGFQNEPGDLSYSANQGYGLLIEPSDDGVGLINRAGMNLIFNDGSIFQQFRTVSSIEGVNGYVWYIDQANNFNFRVNSNSYGYTLIDSSGITIHTLVGSKYYTIPRSQPSTTSNIKSIMTWTGTGSATTTPAFETTNTQVTVTNGMSPYSVLADDDVLWIDATGGNITVTLTASLGRKLALKRVDNTSARTITLTGTVDTVSNPTTYLDGTDFPSIVIESDGTNWWVTASHKE